MSERVKLAERQPIWEQFVEKQDEWIGGTLQEKDHDIGSDDETEITGMEFRHNEKTGQYFFAINGKDWGMECDIRYLAIDPSISGDDWFGLTSTVVGTSWKIKKPEGESHG